LFNNNSSSSIILVLYIYSHSSAVKLKHIENTYRLQKKSNEKLMHKVKMQVP